MAEVNKYGVRGVGPLEITKGGVRVRNASGVLEARNNADNAYAIVRGLTPVGVADLTTKAYVDATAAGFTVLTAVHACTTGALPACTYNNGTLGVGATLTCDANTVLPAQDGVTLVATNRLLVKNQVAGLQNGVYTITSVGVAGVSPWVLTRATEYDQLTEIPAVFIPVTEGATYRKSAFINTNEPEDIVMGTTEITFAEFGNAGNVTGPASVAFDGNVAVYDGLTGTIIKDGGITSATPAASIIPKSDADSTLNDWVTDVARIYEVALVFGSAATVVIGTVPVNFVITEAIVDVTEVFNGATEATVEIGITADQNIIAGVSEIDLLHVGVYTVECRYESAGEAINAYFVNGGVGKTTGAATVHFRGAIVTT